MYQFLQVALPLRIRLEQALELPLWSWKRECSTGTQKGQAGVTAGPSCLSAKRTARKPEAIDPNRV